MLAAATWGALGASTLFLGALIAYLLHPGVGAIGVVMAVGTGLLIGSVSYDLAEEALAVSTPLSVGLFTLLGAVVFASGDAALARRGAQRRKSPGGAVGEATALALVLGAVLDGIPESFVLGLTVEQGAVGVSLFVAIALSNLPEGMASSSGLRTSGWSLSRVTGLWSAVIAASAVAAAGGFLVIGSGGPPGPAPVQAFAAGALLAMLTTTMLPEAYRTVGVVTGPLVVAGFAASLALGAL